MDLEMHKQIVKRQQAGYASLRKIEIDRMRKATFADRLKAFLSIMNFADAMGIRDIRPDDAEVTEKWRKIRARYAERRG
jgi:hypothetical protein